MSTIEELSVQGIRSFGPKGEDMQRITFASPITLILGENGCGKTTIIECLKYALTGEMPPGSERGKNFVHDPKIFSLVDSLGQVKLMVRNIRGERLSVCRSMKISNKRGKMQFETLDATVNFLKAGKDAGNNVDSLSKRCVDVDATMCQFMGVSKAIINNVLFCHQEDSSWPLDEPKKLKEKFDAIFGITEYNKAIEKIIKMRKEEMDELKVKDANLRFLIHLKQEMEDKSMSLQKAQEKCNAINDQCASCDAEMKPIDERLSEIRQIEYEVGKCQALKVESETKLKNCREQIVNLSKKIKKLFEGNIEDVDQEIHSFDRKMALKKAERVRMEQELANLKVQEKNLQKTYMELDKQRCNVIQQRQKEQECNAKRAEKMKTLCSQLNIPLSGDLEQVPEEVPELLRHIKNALLTEEAEIAEKISQNDTEDQQRQVQIDTLRVNMTKLEENITTLQKQKTNYEKERQITERKISEAESSAGRLAEILKSLEDCERYYESFKGKYNVDDMRDKIANGKTIVTQLQQQFNGLDKRLTVLNSTSKLIAEIALKEKELEKKDQEVSRVKSKHSDNFKKVFKRPVEQNFRRNIQTAYENLRREIKELNEKSNGLRLKEQSYEIELNNLTDEIVRSEKELTESKKKVFEKCRNTPYEDLLAKCKTTVTKYQLEHGALRSAEDMYKRYIQKIEEMPLCPLCHKGMSANEVTDLATELSDEIHQLPANISQAEEVLKAEQKKYEGLLQLKPIIEKVSLLEIAIPQRKNELKIVQEKLDECRNDNESLQMLLAEPTFNLNLANSMLGDMSILDEAIKEVSRLKADIEKLKGKLPAHEADVSIEDLQAEKNNVFKKLEEERTKVEDLQQKYEQCMEALNKLRDQKNKLSDQKIKLQEGLQSLPDLKKRHEELIQLVEVTLVEIRDSQSKVQPLKQKLNAAIAEKARCKETNRKMLAQLNTKYDSHKSLDQDIKRLNSEVMDYQELNLVVEITRLKASITGHKTLLSNKNDEIAKVADALDDIKTECLNQETLERDLKDNRELKVLQEKEKDLDEQNKKLTKQLGDMDFRKVSREKTELIQKRDAATVRKGELLGQIGEINNQVKKLQKEIEEPKYKDSVHNFKRANYEVEVSRLLIADLGQYRVALEWSLLQFHAEKMEKINRLIREYWRLIYRGNDIDYIQIQTDNGSETTGGSDRRRSYNYRVIQSKNDSEIEMRGRCSAGQRVLGSLIIRMALAETFSSNCGVLALDEPTTNLDRFNILSLCDALNRIVEERQTQSNFMLIIITHDEDFISTLGKINSYHRIFRNDECKSVIRKVKLT